MSNWRFRFNYFRYFQFGKLRSDALAGFLFWRKWFYDIDNRAAQETGYLFEPIIAHAIGGTPAPAKKSPVKRQSDRNKGRQVDCILDDRAYEFKIRVTIAASGQGRWQEELDFPTDCRTSGFTPVLVCLDSTPNPKLSALVDAFGMPTNMPTLIRGGDSSDIPVVVAPKAIAAVPQPASTAPAAAQPAAPVAEAAPPAAEPAPAGAPGVIR